MSDPQRTERLSVSLCSALFTALGLASLIMIILAFTLPGSLNMKWLRVRAALGQGEAQRELGKRLHHGIGVRKDEVAAAEWYGRAAAKLRLDAELGDAESAAVLGVSLTTDVEMAANYDEARYWLQRAERSGHSGAKKALARLERENPDIADVAARFALHKAAAEQGDSRAMHRLGVAFLYGIGTESDVSAAAAWFERAIAAGRNEPRAYLASLQRVSSE